MRLSAKLSFLKRISLDSPYLTAPFLAVLAGFLLRVAFYSSGACDEIGAHIPAGYLYWQTGKFCGGVANFPLGQLLIALPARIFGLSYTLFTEEHLLFFRLPVIVMALGLAALVYRFAFELFGRRIALAALFFAVFCPNLIAHGSLATLDVPISFFAFLTVYLLWRYVRQPDKGRMAALSLAVGAALATKIQGALLIPICLIVLILRARELMPREETRRVPFFATWLWLFLIPAAVLNLVYLHAPRWNELLPPFFLSALSGKFFHGVAGHPAYLLGQYTDIGWWYYFPVAIAVKTPLPLLVLALWGTARLIRHRQEREFVLLPAAVFMGGLLSMNVDIGVRHALLIYPYLYLLAAPVLVGIWRRSWRVAACLAVWYAAQTTLITPLQLSYFNELAGGPSGGHAVLIDSNYDWGQNDHALRQHVKKRGLEYKIDPDPFKPASGHILVNTNALYGLLNGGPAAYKWLKSHDYIDRVAYVWFEYYIRDDGTQKPEDKTLLRKALADLLDFQEKHRDVQVAEVRLSLARAFFDVHAYDLCLDEARLALKINPSLQEGLIVGGEAVVRHKLGILSFEGDEYLTGFHSLEKLKASGGTPGLTPEQAKEIHVGKAFAKLYHDLGLAYLYSDRDAEAAQAMQKAISYDETYIDPYNMLAFVLGCRLPVNSPGSQETLAWAVSLSQRWPAHAGVQDVLASAYAGTGQYSEALKIAQRANELLSSPNWDAAWPNDLRKRIDLYREEAALAV